MKAILLAVVVCTGCGGNPTAPTGGNGSNPPPIPVIPPVTLTGHLTATNGGQALPGVQAVLGPITTQTDGSGSFSATALPAGSLQLSLTGGSIVPRTLQIALLGTRDLAVSAISLGGGFDMGFYQQFVRDSLESPSLQPLRRWNTSPNLYLQTGLADARTLDMVEAVARQAVPQWTAGVLNVGTVERGPDTRAGQAGWLTIVFSPETQYCGLSDVGKSGGTITLYPLTTACACGGSPVRPRTVRHEVGHAMGFFHTDGLADVMYKVAQACDTPMSAREAYHAAIAYTRPEGNRAPDEDPTTTVSLAPMRKAQ